jgi:hypothetical protein
LLQEGPGKVIDYLAWLACPAAVLLALAWALCHVGARGKDDRP